MNTNITDVSQQIFSANSTSISRTLLLMLYVKNVELANSIIEEIIRHIKSG